MTIKKAVLCLLILLSAMTQSHAQDNKGYFGITLGSSAPLGDFASKDIDNSEAGFAKTGAVIEISFAHKLGEGRSGIAAMIRGQLNPMDAKAYGDEFENLFPGTSWGVKSEAWRIGGLMVGGYSSYPLSNRTTFNIRAMIGYFGARSPEIEDKVRDQAGSYWIETESVTTFSFAYLVGVGINIDIGNKLFLLTSIDHLKLNPEFSNVETTWSDGSKATNTWGQTMGTLNLSIGIALKLDD